MDVLLLVLVWEHDERRRFDICGSLFSSIERLSLLDGWIEFVEGIGSIGVDGGWTFSVLSIVPFEFTDSCTNRKQNKILT